MFECVTGRRGNEHSGCILADTMGLGARPPSYYVSFAPVFYAGCLPFPTPHSGFILADTMGLGARPPLMGLYFYYYYLLLYYLTGPPPPPPLSPPRTVPHSYPFPKR